MTIEVFTPRPGNVAEARYLCDSCEAKSETIGITKKGKVKGEIKHIGSYKAEDNHEAIGDFFDTLMPAHARTLGWSIGQEYFLCPKCKAN